jgi:hypothetical protein
MRDYIDQILRARPLSRDPTRARHLSGEAELGVSREGRPIMGYRVGRGRVRVSLLAGCHADEPVGPRLLRHLVPLLASLPPEHDLLDGIQWWIVPHANPDGELRNRSWQEGLERALDLPAYLRGALRELPGDDMEFGFPRGSGDDGARPENQAILRWWRSGDEPFHLHVSLHGMAFAAGPWFLLEPAWIDRTAGLRRSLSRLVGAMGYELHDVERRGEKGFVRVEKGFATRPDSQAMRRHFLERDDPETASRFRPSSMEAVRALGGDPLTLVPELPLFLTPGVGRELGPPDPVAEAWRERIAGWRARLAHEEMAEATAREVRAEAERAGLRPMPLRDQLALQWAFIVAGVERVRDGRERS